MCTQEKNRMTGGILQPPSEEKFAVFSRPLQLTDVESLYKNINVNIVNIRESKETKHVVWCTDKSANDICVIISIVTL